MHMHLVERLDMLVDMSAVVASAAFGESLLPPLAVVANIALPFAYPWQRSSSLVGTKVHTIAHMAKDSPETGSAGWC